MLNRRTEPFSFLFCAVEKIILKKLKYITMEQVEQVFFQCAFIKVGANFQTYGAMISSGVRSAAMSNQYKL